MKNGYYHSLETDADFEVIVLIENDKVTKYWMNYGEDDEDGWVEQLLGQGYEVYSLGPYTSKTPMSLTKVRQILFLGLL